MKTIKLHITFIKYFFITLIASTLTNCSNKEDLLTDSISITNGITQIKIGEEHQLKYLINSETPENYIIVKKKWFANYTNHFFLTIIVVKGYIFYGKSYSAKV